jgi:Rieske Fe-S protein
MVAFPPLDRDMSVDVVIIGGGITGLTAALLLKRAGVKVTLLEARQIGSGVYLATGYAGNGMTYGTLAGMVLADAFLERPNAWSDLYSPARLKPFTGAKEFISENIDVATHFIGDRMTGESHEVTDIPPNEGRIVNVRGEQLAVYRDEHGQLHACSPVCTHAKCIVHWNTTEKSWDCPCHGGRFDAYGSVLHGPPVSNLETKTPDW